MGVPSGHGPMGVSVLKPMALAQEHFRPQELANMEGMIRTDYDMCQYGMNIDQEGLNKKTTGILTNSEEVAKRMSRRCQGGHEHSPLMGGKAIKAQIYPKKFCEEMVKGIKAQFLKDGSWDEEWAGHVYVEELDDQEDEDEVPEEEAEVSREVAGEGQGGSDISPQEKEALQKLHRGVGHPSLRDFIRFMKAARVR